MTRRPLRHLRSVPNPPNRDGWPGCTRCPEQVDPAALKGLPGVTWHPDCELPEPDQRTA